VNSYAPLDSAAIPLLGPKILLFGGVADFGSDSNKGNYTWTVQFGCKGLEQAFCCFFPWNRGIKPQER
jgi:hypothetical protein